MSPHKPPVSIVLVLCDDFTDAPGMPHDTRRARASNLVLRIEAGLTISSPLTPRRVRTVSTPTTLDRAECV